MIKRKKITAGNYLEIEYYHCRPNGRQARQPKQQLSTEAQAKLNLVNAKKKATRIANANFTGADLFMTFGFTDDKQPNNYEEVQAVWTKFVRDLRKEYKKRDIEFKYMYSIERKTYKTIEDRWHVHAILSTMGFDGDRDMIEKMWAPGEFNNSKRLQLTQNGLQALASYICKEQPGGKNSRRYVCSRNMVKPTIEITDTKLSAGGLARIVATSAHDKTYWEKQYRSYCCTDTDTWLDDYANWHITVKMVKKGTKYKYDSKETKKAKKEGESYDTKKKKEKMPDMQQRRDNL